MNEFRKADAQLRAAIALMESTGVLNEIKALAIEEALLEVSAIGPNGHDYDYDGADLKEYAKKLRGEK